MPPSFGQLAQLVEQRIENPRVRGSIPRLATKNANASQQWGAFSFVGWGYVGGCIGLCPDRPECGSARVVLNEPVGAEVGSM